MQGGSLARLLTQQMKQPWKHMYSLGDALMWLGEVAEGLAHLHAQATPMVHRDIKAENILLTHPVASGKVCT